MGGLTTEAKPVAPGNAEAETRALLRRRALSATVCPSEIARALAAIAGEPADWRRAMPLVHAAVDTLVAQGRVQLSWKGVLLSSRTGPYRIRRGPGYQDF